MREIEYKNSKELGLKIFQESMGYTVIKNSPIVKERRGHGKKYPQFFDESLEIAFSKMLKFNERV